MTGNATYYAYWTPNTYTVTLDAANGSVASKAAMTYPEATVVPDAPFLGGHTFTGWIGTDGEQWDFAKPVTGNVTVTASYAAQLAGVGAGAPDYNGATDHTIGSSE